MAAVEAGHGPRQHPSQLAEWPGRTAPPIRCRPVSARPPPCAGRLRALAAALPTWARGASRWRRGATWALFSRAFLNYDTLYTLIWGRDLLDGRLPDYELTLAPDASSARDGGRRARLAVRHGRRLYGDAGARAAVVRRARLGRVPARPGQPSRGRSGCSPRCVVATREPFLSRAVRAYVDIPFLALVVFAAVLEVRRPRRGWPVLGLLGPRGAAAAGGLAAGGRLLALSRAGARLARRRLRAAALVAAAPVVWALSDLVVTGDLLPLAERHSRHGRDAEAAARHRRRAGDDAAPARRDPEAAGAGRGDGGFFLALRLARATGHGAGRACRARRARRSSLLRVRRPAADRPLPVPAGGDARDLLRLCGAGLARLGARRSAAALDDRRRRPAGGASRVFAPANVEWPGRACATASSCAARSRTTCASSRATRRRSRCSSAARPSTCRITGRCRSSPGSWTRTGGDHVCAARAPAPRPVRRAGERASSRRSSCSTRTTPSAWMPTSPPRVHARDRQPVVGRSTSEGAARPLRPRCVRSGETLPLSISLKSCGLVAQAIASSMLDATRLHVREQVLVERLHPVVVAFCDRVVELRRRRARR